MKNIIREQYLLRIRPYYDSDLIKVITGIRRCGKSIILHQIINEVKTNGVDEDRIIYLDLEGISGRDITDRRSLEDYISQRVKKDDKYYIFIDEIQNLPEFEIAIASIRVSFNCSLFVTGSNSKLLSGKLQDRLTGRAKEFEIYPFTYSEYLEYKKINNIPLSNDGFKDYLIFGGLPQRFNENNDVEVRKYLNGLYDSIIKKDVFNNHIRVNKNVFKQVAKYVLSTSGRLFSALSVAKGIKKNATNKEVKSFSATINNYADYLA